MRKMQGNLKFWHDNDQFYNLTLSLISHITFDLTTLKFGHDIKFKNCQFIRELSITKILEMCLKVV